MGLLHRESREDKAAKAAATAAVDAAVTEMRQARDAELGTNRKTSWPTCLNCGRADLWYPVGQPRHVELRPAIGRPAVAVARRFACRYCGARADLGREQNRYEFFRR